MTTLQDPSPARQARPSGTGAAREAGAALLAAGGLAAGFGAAACCALPAALGAFGLGSAWLFGLALLAGPHYDVLRLAGAACLLGAALLLCRPRGAAACAPGAGCTARPLLRFTTLFGLALGGGLLALASSHG